MHDGMFGLTRDWEAYIHWISLAAEQQYTPAFYNLGFVYEAGLGREASLPQALAWYTKGARLGHLASTKRLIDLYWVNKKLGVLHHLRAMVWRRRLAKKGDAESQRILGIRYEQGWLFQRDVGEAIAWYQRAIEQGDKRAQLWQTPLKEEWETAKAEIAYAKATLAPDSAHLKLVMGRAYLNGLGVPQNLVLALRLLRKSADACEAEAAYWLGKAAQFPVLRQVIPGDAMTWFRRASEGGCLLATRELYERVRYDNAKKKEYERLLHVAEKQGDSWAKEYFQFRVEQALPFVERLRKTQEKAESGDVNAMMELYHRYTKSTPQMEDRGWCEADPPPEERIAEGHRWLKRAINAGYIHAKVCLAIDLSNGWSGFEKSEELATQTYLEAAEQYYLERASQDEEENYERSDDLFELAERYLIGCGVAQSDEQALLWYRRAAEMQNDDASWRIGQFYEAGRGGLPQSYEEALRCYHHTLAELGIVKFSIIEALFHDDKENRWYQYPVLNNDPNVTAWYRAKADSGDSDAQWMFALRLKKGLGVKQDIRMALEYLRRSASQDNLIGMTFLGLMYRDGVGVRESLYLANYWFDKATALLTITGKDTFPETLAEFMWIQEGDEAINADFARASVEIGESHRLFPEEV